MQHPVLAIFLLSLACGLPAQYFDARNHAMGGVGVASSRYVTAGIANPALLTRFAENDSFAIVLPTVGAIVSDEDGLIDAIDAFQDRVDEVGRRLDQGSATPADLTRLSNELLALNGRTAHANVGGGFAFAIPSKELAFSVFLHTYLDAEVFPRIDPTDVGRITAATSSADLDNLVSEGVVLGAAVTDLGVAFAHEIDLSGPGLSFGITPKVQRIDTYNYSINVNTFDEGDFDDSRYRNDDTRFNLDLGAALGRVGGFTFGLMARNLVGDDFDTVVTNGSRFRYSLDPTLTAGAAWTNDLLTLAADIDVTELERFDRGDGSRMLRLGGEFDFWAHAQVRAGVQIDLEDTVDDMFTAGLGISPGNLVHLDLAGSIGGSDSYGAVAQLTFTF